MIVWGSSTKQIGEKTLDLLCNTCKNKSLLIIGFQRVFAIYWIPTIPLKKENIVQCTYCGTQFPCEIYSNYLTANEKTFNTPWWYYSGLMIIAALVTAVSLAEIFNLN